MSLLKYKNKLMDQASSFKKIFQGKAKKNQWNLVPQTPRRKRNLTIKMIPQSPKNFPIGRPYDDRLINYRISGPSPCFIQVCLKSYCFSYFSPSR